MSTMIARTKIDKFPYEFDDLIGQDWTLSALTDLVFCVNANEAYHARTGMLFYGEPGLGKDLAINIIAYQMKGAVMFNIPKGFGSRKPGIWAYLFDITYEYSIENSVPVIIYFNECDGTFSQNVDAIKAAWQLGEKDGGYVLVLGSTNLILNVDSAIKDRFGLPFKFNPLSIEQRRYVLKRKILEAFDGEWKKSLESAHDEEWDSLVELIPHGTSVRYVVVDLIPSVRSRVRRLIAQTDRTKPILLQDFIDYETNRPHDTDTSESTEKLGAKECIVNYLQVVFEVSPYEAGTKCVLPVESFVKAFIHALRDVALQTCLNMRIGALP